MNINYKRKFLEEVNRMQHLMVTEEEKKKKQQSQPTVPAHKLFIDTKRYRMKWYSHHDDDNCIVCQLAGKPKDYDEILRVITDMDFPAKGYKVTDVDTLNAEEWDSSILHYCLYDPEKPIIRISYEYDPDIKTEYNKKHQSVW